MNTITIDAAIELLLEAATHAGEISAAINAAKAEGRTTLSDEQWAAILASDDKARAALAAAVGK